MTVKKNHARVRRYGNALIDPDFRLEVTHNRARWITDRFVLVRADMFQREPTVHMPNHATYGERHDGRLRNKAVRDLLVNAWTNSDPAEYTGHHVEQRSNRLTVVWVRGRAAVPVNARLTPLMNTFDFTRFDRVNYTVLGFQKRSVTPKPVLVAVICPVRWETFDDEIRLTRGEATA